MNIIVGRITIYNSFYGVNMVTYGRETIQYHDGLTGPSQAGWYRVIAGGLVTSESNAILLTESLSLSGNVILVLNKASIDKEVPSYLKARTLTYLVCLLYTSPSPRDLSTSRMPSSA